MTPTSYAIDLSHHQDPKSLNWSELPARFQSVYVRATYGCKPDREASKHSFMARHHGRRVGFYHYLTTNETIPAQLKAFQAQLDLLGCSENLAPVVDAEEPGLIASHVSAFYSDLVYTNGAAMIYTSELTWNAYGHPKDWLSGPLWLARYPKIDPNQPIPLDKMPSLAGVKPVMWQYLVAPIPGFSTQKIDQNAVFGVLPSCL